MKIQGKHIFDITPQVEGLGDLALAVDVAGKAPLVHTHPISDIVNLQSTLNNKAALIHTHVIGDVFLLQNALDGKAPLSHSHIISDVTGLQTALDGKANTSHSHAISDVTGLQTALDAKANTSHSHVISDVTGLQSALDNKQNINTLGSKNLSLIAQNPGASQNDFLYKYNDTSGEVDLVDPKDIVSDYVVLGGLTAGNNTAHGNRLTTNIFFANIPANKTVYRVEYRAFTIPAIATTDSFTVSLKNANGHSTTVAPVFATVSALPTLDSAAIGGIRATQTWQVLIGSNNVNISTGTGLLLALTATRTANIGNITDLLVTVYFK